jgi:hypothetical protein
LYDSAATQNANRKLNGSKERICVVIISVSKMKINRREFVKYSTVSIIGVAVNLNAHLGVGSIESSLTISAALAGRSGFSDGKSY